MAFMYRTRHSLTLAFGLLALGGGACAKSTPPSTSAAPQRDPRVGLRAGRYDAAEAVSNLKVLSKTQPPERHVGATNSDIAFTGTYAIQGNYNGPLIWDISNPSKPALKAAIFCPASQNDVSVYRNLLFVSAEAYNGRLDCAAGGFTQADSVSKLRMRGIRIFDISDMANPKYVHSVQTCRGSHTHTVLEDPKDKENVYIYVSGSAPVRSPNEMPGCTDKGANPNDPENARFRIEVIKVPLANPTAAAIVASPRIFTDLVAPPRHGEAPEDIAAAKARVDSARKAGGYIVTAFGQEQPMGNNFVRAQLDSLVKVRGGTGAPTAADSAKLRTEIQAIVDKMIGANQPQQSGPRPGPTQCHDITVYPALGLAGGACEGYGFLLDISDPLNPRRIGAVADSNFAYWHSATFNN
ncbi:MAG: LVIVD repeat-containing protein, partial [Gemmatimonadaceae bacterium]